MLPLSCARIAGSTALQHSHTPLTLTANRRSQTAGSSSSNGVSLISRKYAALLTSPSMRPKRSTAAFAIASVEPASDTSTCTASALPPARSMSATVSSAGFRSATTTLAPCSAQPTAKAWPIPVAAPVTMIVRSLSKSCALMA